MTVLDLHCCAWPSLVAVIRVYPSLWCTGFSLQWLLLQLQQLWHSGLVALQHMGSSRTKDWIHVPYIGKWILNHRTTREVPCFTIERHFLLDMSDFFLFRTLQTSFYCLLIYMISNEKSVVILFLVHQCNIIFPSVCLQSFFLCFQLSGFRAWCSQVLGFLKILIHISSNIFSALYSFCSPES